MTIASRVLQAQSRLVYSTPTASLVKLAKVFSISTLTISSISTPALLYFWESPAVQAAGINEYMFITESTARYVIINYVFAALAASTCSTGALHYLLSPFISSIYLHAPPKSSTRQHPIQMNSDVSSSPSTDIITPKSTITLETLDLLARPKHTTVQLQDLKPSTRTLLTWTCTKQFIANHPDSSPGRFLLDKRGGVGDQQAMRQIVQVIDKQDQRQRLI